MIVKQDAKRREDFMVTVWNILRNHKEGVGEDIIQSRLKKLYAEHGEKIYIGKLKTKE